MNRFSLLILITLLFSACNSSHSVPDNFAPSELYQGYPCADYCPEFQKGYDAAIKNGITDATACREGSIEEVAGCKAFVADYRYENQSFREYLESL